MPECVERAKRVWPKVYKDGNNGSQPQQGTLSPVVAQD